MLSLSPATKVHLLAGSTDMRLGFAGLLALASGLLCDDPLGGHLFVFCNKQRTRLKALFWDGSGLWVCAKRHAPQCAYWFAFKNPLSIPSALREGLRILWFGGR